MEAEDAKNKPVEGTGPAGDDDDDVCEGKTAGEEGGESEAEKVLSEAEDAAIAEDLDLSHQCPQAAPSVPEPPAAAESVPPSTDTTALQDDDCILVVKESSHVNGRRLTRIPSGAPLGALSAVRKVEEVLPPANPKNECATTENGAGGDDAEGGMPKKAKKNAGGKDRGRGKGRGRGAKKRGRPVSAKADGAPRKKGKNSPATSQEGANVKRRPAAAPGVTGRDIMYEIPTIIHEDIFSKIPGVFRHLPACCGPNAYDMSKSKRSWTRQFRDPMDTKKVLAAIEINLRGHFYVTKMHGDAASRAIGTETKGEGRHIKWGDDGPGAWLVACQHAGVKPDFTGLA